MPSPPNRLRKKQNSTQGPPYSPQRPDGKPFLLDHASDKKSLTTGSVIGIVVGSMFGVLCIIVVVMLCLRKVEKGKDGSVNNGNDTGRSVTVGSDKGYFSQL